MGFLRLVLLVIAACLVVPASAWSVGTEPSPPEPSPRVGIFYYPWFATPQRDGGFAHWQQGGSTPPATLASGFYPARGAYSSADALVVDAQMTRDRRRGHRHRDRLLVGARLASRTSVCRR